MIFDILCWYSHGSATEGTFVVSLGGLPLASPKSALVPAHRSDHMGLCTLTVLFYRPNRWLPSSGGPACPSASDCWRVQAPRTVPSPRGLRCSCLRPWPWVSVRPGFPVVPVPPSKAPPGIPSAPPRRGTGDSGPNLSFMRFIVGFWSPSPNTRECLRIGRFSTALVFPGQLPM